MEQSKYHLLLDTPILFLIFNRPEITKKAFDIIRQARPKQLFIAADGPRADYPEDVAKCQKAREIAANVDWNCNIKTLFRKKNHGCQLAVSSAINWFFNNVDEGIILEDDCLPDVSFFQFCQELLKYYRHDQRIFVISGNNFQKKQKQIEYSYYFSCFNHCWGWATWKRAWKYFDFNMKLWPTINKKKLLKNIWLNHKNRKYWENIFKKTYKGDINSWAYRWTFACWINNGLSILPNLNLVSNIGFIADATHTTDRDSFNSIPAQSMNFPLKHPPFMIQDKKADNFTMAAQFNISFYKIITRKLKNFIEISKS